MYYFDKCAYFHKKQILKIDRNDYQGQTMDEL